MKAKEIYSVKEVAEMYNLAETSVRSYIARGQLHATKFNNQTYIITPQDLKEWEKTRKPRKRETE